MWTWAHLHVFGKPLLSVSAWGMVSQDWGCRESEDCLPLTGGRHGQSPWSVLSALTAVAQVQG